MVRLIRASLANYMIDVLLTDVPANAETQSILQKSRKLDKTNRIDKFSISLEFLRTF